MRYHTGGVKCKCGESFDNPNLLRHHKMSCKRAKQILCHVCKSLFNDRWTLNSHFKKNHPQIKLYECKTCGMILKSPIDLKRHEEQHAEDALICQYCSFEFTIIKERKVHELKHLDKNGEVHFNCHYCPAKFEGPVEYADHFRIHFLQILPHNCKYCPRRFQSQWNCANHILAVHTDKLVFDKNDKLSKLERITIEVHGLESELDPSLERNDSGKLAFNCNTCQKRFYGCNLISNHYHSSIVCKSENNNKKKISNVNIKLMKSNETAKKVVFSKSQLDMPKTSEKDNLDLDNTASNPNETNENYCHICEKSLGTEGYYKIHMKSHEGEFDCRFCGIYMSCPSVKRRHETKCEHNKKEYTTCHLCNNEFEDLQQLGNHLKEEHPEREKHECECGFVAANQQHLENHQLRHIDSKWFKCSTCRKGYANKTALTTHMGVHNGRYKCNICGSNLGNFSSLRDHMKVHEGSKLNDENFKCLDCDEVFKDRMVFHKHKKEMHPNYMPYECENCGKRLPTKPQYEMHMQGNTEEPSFKCELCGRTFRFETSYKSHLKIHERSKTNQEQECFYCEKRISDLFTMQRHIAFQHPDKIKMVGNARLYKCPQCNTKERVWYDFMRHYKSHFRGKRDDRKYELLHVKKTRDAQGRKTVDGSLFAERFEACPKVNPPSYTFCKFCPRRYKTPSEWATHLVFRHKKKIVSTVDDKLTDVERASLLVYGVSEDVAAGPERNENSELAFNCRKCGKKIYGFKLLNSHYLRGPNCKTILDGWWNTGKLSYENKTNQSKGEGSSRVNVGSNSDEEYEEASEHSGEEDDIGETFNDADHSLTTSFDSNNEPEVTPLPLAAAVQQHAASDQNTFMMIWCQKFELDLLTLTSLNSHRVIICVMENTARKRSVHCLPAKLSLEVSTINIKFNGKITTAELVHGADILLENGIGFNSIHKLETRLKFNSELHKVVHFMRSSQYNSLKQMEYLTSKIVLCNHIKEV